MRVILNSILILIITAVVTITSYRYLNPIKSDKPIKISVNRLNDKNIKELTAPVSTNNSVSKTTPPATPTTTPIAPKPVPVNTLSLSTSVNYGVPGGNQNLSVKVTLQNNIIVSISTSHSMGSKSKKYQQNFENNYKSQVVGKNINSINLSRVSGASLTTNAFNQAIAGIRNSL